MKMIKRTAIIAFAAVLLCSCGTGKDSVKKAVEEPVSVQEEDITGITAEKPESLEDFEEGAAKAEAETGDVVVEDDYSEELQGDYADETDYSALSTNETIKLYDIEEGYFTAPFYRGLPQNDYDWSYINVNGQFLEYDDPDYDTAAGIDVSKFQGAVDWDKIKAQGFDFAIIRLGYRGYGNGALITDERFEENIKGAQKAGLEVGVYFLSQAMNEAEAVEEALYTLNELERCAINPVTYPIVIDSEKIKFDTSRTESMNGAERTDTILAYKEVIENAGYDCALYANSKWLTTVLDIRRLTGIDIWFADYQITDNNEAPLYPYPFTIWQYTNKGRLDGIEGDVDLNISFKRKS